MLRRRGSCGCLKWISLFVLLIEVEAHTNLDSSSGHSPSDPTSSMSSSQQQQQPLDSNFAIRRQKSKIPNKQQLQLFEDMPMSTDGKTMSTPEIALEALQKSSQQSTDYFTYWLLKCQQRLQQQQLVQQQQRQRDRDFQFLNDVLLPAVGGATTTTTNTLPPSMHGKRQANIGLALATRVTNSRGNHYDAKDPLALRTSTDVVISDDLYNEDADTFADDAPNGSASYDCSDEENNENANSKKSISTGDDEGNSKSNAYDAWNNNYDVFTSDRPKFLKTLKRSLMPRRGYDNGYKGKRLEDQPRYPYDFKTMNDDNFDGGGNFWSDGDDSDDSGAIDGGGGGSGRGLPTASMLKAWRNRKLKRPRNARVGFLPSISVGALANLGDFFNDLSNNVHYSERTGLGHAEEKLLSGVHPLQTLQEAVGNRTETRAEKEAEFIKALKTYYPSQKVRNLVSMFPRGYHGSQFLDPNYIWVGLGK